jgi:hypothetical protein
MPNETRYGAANPGHGHRVVLAERVVETLARQKRHAKAAAAWAKGAAEAEVERDRDRLRLRLDAAGRP